MSADLTLAMGWGYYISNENKEFETLLEAAYDRLYDEVEFESEMDCYGVYSIFLFIKKVGGGESEYYTPATEEDLIFPSDEERVDFYQKIAKYAPEFGPHLEKIVFAAIANYC